MERCSCSYAQNNNKTRFLFPLRGNTLNSFERHFKNHLTQCTGNLNYNQPGIPEYNNAPSVTKHESGNAKRLMLRASPYALVNIQGTFHLFTGQLAGPE